MEDTEDDDTYLRPDTEFTVQNRSSVVDRRRYPGLAPSPSQADRSGLKGEMQQSVDSLQTPVSSSGESYSLNRGP